jgi:hypothetical protein
MSAQPWESRLSHIEGRLGHDDLVQHVDARFAQADVRFESMERKIDDLRREMTGGLSGMQWRLSAFILGTWITTMLAIVFRH